ncbi:LOW QUALITY PROTEIN: uncharacterized protein [Excalfactoria chinensis]|uniref:LOW QUALITY PROTEIN: uncharacterized protein n=1 Tax=Excalfactoria chinensis TaxID=46218 RepID=UPI003B3B7C35
MRFPFSFSGCHKVVLLIQLEGKVFLTSMSKEHEVGYRTTKLIDSTQVQNICNSKPDFQMSEEEDVFQNVKRSLKRKLVKHSTPVNSTFSRKTLSLSGPMNWSVKDQDISKRACVSPVPKSTLGRSVAQLSLASVETYFPYMSPKIFSSVFDLQDSSREISQSSQVVYSRRRLSTVLASDESNEEAIEKAVSSEETQTPTEASEKSAVTPQSGSSQMVSGIPGIKDPPVLKKKKIDKAIVVIIFSIYCEIIYNFVLILYLQILLVIGEHFGYRTSLQLYQ